MSPVRWSVEAGVRERFAAAGIAEDRLSCTPATDRLIAPKPPSTLLVSIRDCYGPTMNAGEAAREARRADALQNELETLFSEQHTIPGNETTSIPATFLRVEVGV